MRSTISSKSEMILPKASCISITASAARRRSSNAGCLIKIPLYVDEVIAALIRIEPQVWQRQREAKRGVGSGEWGMGIGKHVGLPLHAIANRPNLHPVPLIMASRVAGKFSPGENFS